MSESLNTPQAQSGQDLAATLRKVYVISITLTFILIFIPTLLSILAHKPILIQTLKPVVIKLYAVYAICIAESLWIKNILLKLGGLLGFLLLYNGIQYKIMHWPNANETMIAGVAIFVACNLYAAIREKNKSLLNYLLIFYVVFRLIFILARIREFLWWADVVLGGVVMLAALRELFLMWRKAKKEPSIPTP